MTKSNKFNHLGQNLNIAYMGCDELRPYESNPRTHSKDQLKQIAKSIKEFGFTNPILIDNNNNIIAGHGRLEGAKIIGLDKVPTIQLGYLDKKQRHAYMIADNKLAEKAGWNFELLSSELILIEELDLDFDLTLTGFEIEEIDELLSNNESTDETQIPNPPEKPVSQLGDIWYLGNHIIYCGDATKEKSYDILLDGDKANMIFTDPPYNVPIDGHVCGNGQHKHDEFKMASGEMSEAEFTDFLNKTFKNLIAHSTNSSLHYVCMDWRHMNEIITASKIYDETKNLCVWNKTNGGMGSFYRSKHELVFVFKNGAEPHQNNINLGKNGRYRTNVWDYAGVNTFQNNKDLKLHPTVKPIAMIQDAILDCTKKHDIILDAFGGSGSTLIAAEQSGRKARIIELDPKYVDVMIKRFEESTGKEALHDDYSTFDEKREERHG